ncbi:hypothetical protein TWF694_006855 [Orbilia ellipsospora]|uniref:Yeast cell wall synthesis Kre9/Knh1-like N-terminal domain-containing protein n=1 Tax=Orbilia ellipsospora TaxID=2528407 RepID=A0AAV9XPU4_9PEZI
MRAWKLVFIFITSINFVASQSTKANAITAPTAGTVLTEGQQFTIKWIDIVGDTVSLVLLEGPTGDLRTLAVIAEGITNTGTYAWVVPDGVAVLSSSSDYTIRISYDSNPNDYNYSDRFAVLADASTSDVATTSTPTTVNTSSSSRSESTIASSSSPTSNPPTSTFSRSVTSRTDPPVSKTSSPTSATSNSTPTTSSTNPPITSTKSSGPGTGVIVGAVIGGLALLIVGGLIALWIIVRERRKREAMVAPTLPPPDPNNQSIWEGNKVYSYNPNKAAPDVYPGREEEGQGLGSGAPIPSK